MRPKFFLLLLTGVLGTLFCSANIGDPEPGEVVKRNEVYGNIIQTQTKGILKDVNVTAYIDSKKSKVLQSDNEGNYAIEVFKPGVYKIVFEKQGYKKVVKENIFIRTDESYLLNIEMLEMDELDLFPSLFHFLGK